MKEIAEEIGFTIPDFVREADLREILRMIKGEGKYQSLGKGIHAYPKDEKLNECCLELEKQGLIYRKINEKDHILWMSTATKEVVK